VRVLSGLMLSVPPESIVNWSAEAATLRVTVWGLRIVTVSALVVGTSVALDHVEQAGEGALSQVPVAFQFPVARLLKQSVALDASASSACDAKTDDAAMSATRNRLDRPRRARHFKDQEFLAAAGIRDILQALRGPSTGRYESSRDLRERILLSGDMSGSNKRI
jgi:hypothetical protein